MVGLQMVLDAPSPDAAAAPGPRRSGSGPLAVSLAALLSLVVGGDWHPERRWSETVPAAAPAITAETREPPAGAAAPAEPPAEILAAAPPPAPDWSAPTPVPWQSALLDSLLDAVPVAPSDPAEAPVDADAADPVQPPAPLARPVPLPVPRPPELRGPRVAEPLRSRSAARRAAVAAPPAPAEDNRSFVEKLFGLPASAPSPGLAYAALDPNPVAPPPIRRLIPTPSPDAARLTAIYDISARTVTLPNGERLEAHSGLGPHMDDPRFVHVRMRGATPPGTYDLSEREALFHGVRAIRLNPVGGSGAVHGRVGLLAHTYMLGPSGASNGCVSFKDYERFLQAFLRGEVQRLVVVAGRGQDGPPGDRRIGLSDRSAGGNGA
ncbi:DUF2778 domain-containing protein [Methylobacterium sp. ID0610]|uniref:DUF2778 domain-containing protein n=1 Tax=Methylobacterium carpenticola TaxID=3344827 RepID=UPI003689F5A0